MVEEEQEKPEANTAKTAPNQESATFPSAPTPKQVLITDEELRHLQHELLEYKEKYLHLLADADNARKRLQKEKQELIRHALERFIVDILRPVDNLDHALRFAQDMSDEVKNWAFGFQMILTQFKDTLAQHHVVMIESIGKPFNPHEHEAIEMIESTEPPGIVIEEFVRGYKMGDRTIRPARVKVSKLKESPPSQENQQNQNKK